LEHRARKEGINGVQPLVDRIKTELVRAQTELTALIRR
jgi:hypothetical protein